MDENSTSSSDEQSIRNVFIFFLLIHEEFFVEDETLFIGFDRLQK